VLGNLAQYLNHLDDPRRLTVKYMVIAENFDTEELEAFAEAA